MKYVYFLESINFKDANYVGLTHNLRARLAAHNAGKSRHTSKYRPWRLVTYVAFADEQKNGTAMSKHFKFVQINRDVMQCGFLLPHAPDAFHSK
jgi:predicted GIY-YIG superfamily endonuclease